MIRVFEVHDYPIVEGWMRARKKSAPHRWFLPKTGLIIDNCACGFLITTNAGFGILDFYMSNPEIDKDLRDRALDEITESLLMMAARLELLGVKCDSKLKTIKDRAIKHGFVSMGEFSSFFKEI